MLNLYVADLAFLLVALPLFLLVYYLAPARFRPAILLVQSILYYWYAARDSLSLMLMSVLMDFTLIRLMEQYDENARARRSLLWVSVAKSGALLLYSGMMAQVRTMPYVLGIQIYTLSALAAVAATYRREIPYEKKLLRFAVVCCFFPKLYTGPLVPYQDFARQLDHLQMRPGAMLSGAGQSIQGAFKVSVIGGSLYGVYGAAGSLAAQTALGAWTEVFSIAFALYFMLSGFNDIALGMGKLFGIVLPKNFYYPYQSRSVEDFFDRFNITVSRFIRETLHIGPGQRARGELANLLHILAAGVLMGLWFGLRVNYVFWGLYLGVFIILERYVYTRFLDNLPVLFSRIGTLCVVLAGFTIFCRETPGQSVQLIRTMFDTHHPFDQEVLYLLSSNWLLLAVSCLFATNAVNLVVTKLHRAAPTLAMLVFGACDVGILILYVALCL